MESVQSVTSVEGAGPGLILISKTCLVQTLTAFEINGQIGKEEKWLEEPCLRLPTKSDTITDANLGKGA